MQMRESISAGGFIGFCGGLIMFIIFFGQEIQPKINNLPFVLIVWIVIYATFMIFGFNKEGLFAFGISIYRILTDKISTSEQKFSMLMQSAQSILGFAADLSFLINEKEQEEKKEKKEVKKEECISRNTSIEDTEDTIKPLE